MLDRFGTNWSFQARLHRGLGAHGTGHRQQNARGLGSFSRRTESRVDRVKPAGQIVSVFPASRD
jgi:hypothetical protein